MKKLSLLAILVVTLVVVSASTPASAGPVMGSGDPASAGVIYFDMVVDDSRRLVYGSDREGGTVHVVSMATLDVVRTLIVGAEPAGLDISPDGSELAVALYGQGEIAFLSLDTLSVISRTVPADTIGPNRPYDLLYGRPGRLYSVGNPGSRGIDYVHVFDAETKQELGRSTDIMRSAPRLAMTADQNTLYVSDVNSSPQKIYGFDVTSDVPTLTAVAPHGPVSVNTLCVMSDDRVYSSRGQVWSADLTTQLGAFEPGGDEIECSDLFQKVYVNSGTRIAAIDTTTLASLNQFDLGATTGVARLDGAGKKLYVSTDDGVKVVAADLEPRAYLPLAARTYCLDYYDDFGNPASGWPVVDNSNVLIEYVDGEYRIRSKKDSYLYFSAAPTCAREDYVVQVDARWEGRPGGSYGILFGIQGSYDAYYLFDVNADYRMFRLYRRTPSGSTLLAPITPSQAIYKGNATNRLKVRREGSQITLYANGTVLGQYQDGEIAGLSRVGLIASPYVDHPTSDARFDNFGVVGLYAGGTSASGADRTGAGNSGPRTLEAESQAVPLDLAW